MKDAYQLDNFLGRKLGVRYRIITVIHEDVTQQQRNEALRR